MANLKISFERDSRKVFFVMLSTFDCGGSYIFPYEFPTFFKLAVNFLINSSILIRKEEYV